MPDKFYVYRPVLDLIGHSEGTDKGRGYNETLAYGAYTGGAVDLVSMTLDQVDALQTKMLRHPKNKWKSSACGRYQIVRTTLREIRKALGLTGAELFDEAMQDRLACYLLGVRGIDKYLAGRLSVSTLLNNLAHEWASLPLPSGKGAYGGQNAAVTPARVQAALAMVKMRHADSQPKIKVDKPVVPKSVETEVQRKTSWWQKVTGVFTGGGIGGGLLYGMDRETLIIVGIAGVVIVVALFFFGRQLVKRFKAIRAEIEAD